MDRRRRDDSERIRAFFAVPLGEAAQRAAALLQQALQDGPGGNAVRWVRPEALHVTLRFLGEIDPARIPALVSDVRAELAPRRGFALQLGGLSGLPSPRRPRVVILDVTPHEPLVELAAAVERGVVASGFEPETRRFRAHLTLGRVRARYALPLDLPASPPAPFAVAEAVLYRSQLGRGGSRYTPLERVTLGGANHP